LSYTIAFAGKGGTGKTTLCGLLINSFCREGKGPVLAVDADANSNLNEVLGVEAPVTLGNLREEIKSAGVNEQMPVSMTKQAYLEVKFSHAIIEEQNYDLLVMGRTQGAGCYCFVNGLLTAHLQRYANNYRYVIVDNEAGMEHLSRGVLPQVDLLLIISDCSRRGVQAAGRIRELTGELGMKPGRIRFIINRAPPGELSPGIQEETIRQKLMLAGVVPQDDMISRYDREGIPTAHLPPESEARRALTNIFSEALQL
jgi:CO dehydrogenase maturation factor